MSAAETAAPAAYTPRVGSKAEAAALELQARGELSTAELADALDCDSGTLHSLLAVPIKWGYLAREKRNGITRWRMGDGTPPPTEPDDDPPVQRVVSAAAAPPIAGKRPPATMRAPRKPRAAAAPRKAATEPKPTKPRPRAARPQRPLVLAATAAAAPVRPDFRFGLFTDGSLVLEQGGQCITLAREQTERLVGWLERLTVKEETTS